jgi:hypothetical protein
MTFQCNNCFGKFSKSLITNKICQFCTNRMEIQKDLNFERRCRTELEEKVDVLNEKVNVLEAKLNSILDNKQNNEEVNVNKDTYTTVKSKKNPNQLTSEIPLKHIPISNRFELLNENEELENMIIGDSQIRNIGTIISKRKKKSKKKNIVLCYPGAGTSFLNNKIEELDNCKESSDIGVHIGGNDIRKSQDNSFTPTEDLIKKFKIILESLQRKSRKSFMIGILPRHNESFEWHSRAISINNRLSTICKTFEVDFIDPWSDFYENRTYYDKKGIHLSNSGSNKLADIIINHFNKIQYQGN